MGVPTLDAEIIPILKAVIVGTDSKWMVDKHFQSGFPQRRPWHCSGQCSRVLSSLVNRRQVSPTCCPRRVRMNIGLDEEWHDGHPAEPIEIPREQFKYQ